MDGQKIWSAILSDIKNRMSLSIYKTWFSGSFILDYKKETDKNLLIVGVRNNFLKEQIEARYVKTISEIACKKSSGKIEIIFVVANKEINQTKGGGPIFSGIPQKYISNGRKAESLNPNHSFDNFVVGSSNNIAYIAARQVSKNLGSTYNPLLIYGSTGVGKTHLLQAIGNEVLNTIVDAKVLYASSEKFTNDYIESLNNHTQPIVRNRYRSVDLLLVDDIQFFAGKESTQDEFFYTFNDLYLGGKQLVIACDRHPKELGKLKERLVSRFLGGMNADIGTPDLEMKIAILKSKCQEKGINLGDEVINYIASSTAGNVREIEGILISVLSISRLSGGGVTLDKIKSIVDNARVNNSKTVSPQKIIGAVCSYFGVGEKALLGSSRKAAFVCARQTLMYLLRKKLNLSLSEIGEIAGDRDHSTVIYGIEKVEYAISQNHLKLDEIHRVEAFIQ